MPNSAFVNTEKAFGVIFFARFEKEPTTKLAKRLREIRHTLGFTERKQFAKHFEIPETTIRNYETGLREPPASILQIYKDRCWNILRLARYW